ncbi:hypothetical protein NKH77_17470 [Streptomyces sp. M19]
MRAIPYGQSRQPVTAGHDGQTTITAGQERTNLADAGGIVEDNENSAVGKQRPIQRGCGIDVRRHGVGGNAECGEKAVQRLPRGDGFLRIVTPQIDVELPVGETVSDPVRPVQGE